MRIGLVIFHADPARGGAERYTVDLAAGLRARGAEVTLIASSFPKTSGEGDGPLAGISPVSIPAKGATRLNQYISFLNGLDRHLASTKYDIVHAMLPVRQCDIYHPHAGIAAEAVASGHLKYSGGIAKAAAKLANRANLKRRKFRSVERALLTDVNPPIVLCLSEYVKCDVVAQYPNLSSNLATLFNAVDLERFDPAVRPQARDEIRKRFAIAPDRVVALMIAQDYQRKGLREAILALGKLADPRMVLLVVGKQPPGTFGRVAKETGVGDRVIFAGSTTDPYSFYRAADLFVLPTRHDPCSLVVLEALAMGLPVISTVFNGACEVMTDGKHGFVLADPANVNALADALREIAMPRRRHAMAEACLLLRATLSYEHHLDRLMDVYRARISSQKK